MGAVGYRLYTVKSAPVVSAAKKQPPSPDEFRKRVVSKLNETLKLDPSQSTDVEKIYEWQFDSFNEIHNKYEAEIAPLTAPVFQKYDHERDQIHDQSVAKIKALLRPDQQPLYDKWLADRAADRARRQQEHKDHPDGGKQHRPMPPLP